MKQVIDIMLKEQRKNFIDYDEYIKKNLDKNAKEASYFDKFIYEIPINKYNSEPCINFLDNEKLTKSDRQKLKTYTRDKIDDLQIEETVKLDNAYNKVESVFKKFLYNQFNYTGNNKELIFNLIYNMLDLDEDFKYIHIQFIDVCNKVSSIIKLANQKE